MAVFDTLAWLGKGLAAVAYAASDSTSSIQVIGEYLTAVGTPLYTLVGTRVKSPVAPKGWTNTTAAILYQCTERAHASDSYARFVTCTFKCYGGSALPSDAVAVYEALVTRLHGVSNDTSASGRIAGAFLSLSSLSEMEEETGWPFARAQYDIHIQKI